MVGVRTSGGSITYRVVDLETDLGLVAQEQLLQGKPSLTYRAC